MSENTIKEEAHSSILQSSESEDYTLSFASKGIDDEETVILTSEEISKNWMEQALKSFDASNRQYSVYLKEGNSFGTDKITIETLENLATNAQDDLSKILNINSIIRQKINVDDLIGIVYEAVIANLNTNVRISFDALPQKPKKKYKDQAESLIKQFHKETNINEVLKNSISTVYTEGNYIKYLRKRNNHYVIDHFPLGIAIVSDYSMNSIPYVLIDINELLGRLQGKGIIKGKNNKPLFFESLTQEIMYGYPTEVYKAMLNKERYAVLNLRHTGLNRFGNLNRKYGLSPIFKALKPALMLDTFDKSDTTNAKAKAKKIIHQVMRKETMGATYEKKGLEDMAYAHSNLMAAWKNPTVVYTSPPSVEKVVYVEPKVETTNTATIKYYRSRVTSALGISFMNTDGEQTVSTASISIAQLMRTINKIAEQEERILSQWYSVILEDNDIPQEYCPSPHILDAELLEFDLRKELSELLYSKYNCSFETALGLVGIDVRDEVERRKQEKELGYEDIFTVHPTSYNSSGNSDDSEGGRPTGTTNGDNVINEEKIEYDQVRNNAEVQL